MKCICRKCGRINTFPQGIKPEAYGWTWMPDDTMYCFKCEPEGGEKMSKIVGDELWDNFSFAVRDDRTGKIGYVRIKDFFENLEIVKGEE